MNVVLTAIWSDLLKNFDVLFRLRREENFIMASRAILRRKRFVSDYLKKSTTSIQTFQGFHQGQATQYLDSSSFSTAIVHSSGRSSFKKNEGRKIAPKEELLYFSGTGSIWQRFYGISTINPGSVGPEFVSVFGSRWIQQSSRFISTATAKKPDLGNNDEDKDAMVAKKRKEASAEDCDQAVEGLSTAKAKAKEKQLQESKNVVKTILRRVWAALLGVGPALRAVASMSRFLAVFFLFVGQYS